MREYSIVAVIWEDHTQVSREPLPIDLDKPVETTLSFGIIAQETDKILYLVNEIERYEERDDCTYMMIFKHAILSQKEYGKIKLTKIRR